MHLPPLFVFHEQPQFRLVGVFWVISWFLIYISVGFIDFSLRELDGFFLFLDDFVTLGHISAIPAKQAI